MNAWWNQRSEPRGHDPYNSSDIPVTASREIVEAMERVWKECCRATVPRPAFIIPSAGFWDSYYELLATPDRGYEFEPYARG